MLANRDGRRVAVIVNDEINVDAALMAGGQAALDRTEERLVEMTNGCICCTLRDDLLVEVARLADEGRFDHLLIESTGISEPMPVAATFLFADELGRSLSATARLDAQGLWSQAGLSIQLEPLAMWMAAVPEDEWDLDPAELADLHSRWDPLLGDRQNELVFIGIDMDEIALRSRLDACVLTPAEFEQGLDAWTTSPTPSPSGTPPATSTDAN